MSSFASHRAGIKSPAKLGARAKQRIIEARPTTWENEKSEQTANRANLQSMITTFLTNAGLAPDAPAFWLVFLLGLALAVSIVHAVRLSRRLQQSRIRLASVEARADTADTIRQDLVDERARREAMELGLAAEKAKLEEREKAHGEMSARLDAEFKATTAEMLDNAHKAFFTRTKDTFERYQESADADGQRRRKALDDLLKPVSETLVRYEKGLVELRDEQQKSRGELAGHIGELSKSTQNVRNEAQKLASALRAGPKTRGRWGEEQLRNVVEIAGMAAYVDFTEQASHSDGDKRKQPDLVVRLPGGRVVVVDSKVSLGAYLDAMEADNDDTRAACLARHADDVWNHVKALSAKDYAASLRGALDYVVMFLPGENYFSAALEARPQLYQDAFDRKILIATPTILIAMLKSAALNWRQEKMNENAEAIAAMAKDLYDSLKRMGDNLSGLGRSIERTVKQYNDVVANVEGRVLPRARKFADYELPGAQEPIAELSPIEGAPRALRADKDLLLSEADPKDLEKKAS
jgi:DNA recombination protein RmuC